MLKRIWSVMLFYIGMNMTLRPLRNQLKQMFMQEQQRQIDVFLFLFVRIKKKEKISSSACYHSNCRLAYKLYINVDKLSNVS